MTEAARDASAAVISRARSLDTPEQSVIATDPAGRILFWSYGAERLYGWTAREVLGLDVVDVTPTDLSREEAMRIMDSLRDGNSWQGDFMVRRKDGSMLAARVVDIPVRDTRGELIGIIGVSQMVPRAGEGDAAR